MKNYSILAALTVTSLCVMIACGNKCATSSTGSYSTAASTDPSCSNYVNSSTNLNSTSGVTCINNNTGQPEAPLATGACAADATPSYSSGQSYGSPSYSQPSYGNGNGYGSGSNSGGYMTTNGTCYNPSSGQSYYPQAGRC